MQEFAHYLALSPSAGIEADLERIESLRWDRAARLARRFPSLARLDGVAPFDADRLENATLGDAVSLQAWHSVRFVLSSLNPARANRVGRFDYFQAWQAWDLAHKQAFLSCAMESTLADIHDDFEDRTSRRDGW